MAIPIQNLEIQNEELADKILSLYKIHDRWYISMLKNRDGELRSYIVSDDDDMVRMLREMIRD
jgi:hypothetical protein